MDDTAVTRLRAAIIGGKLLPNQRLVESEVSQEFSIGRAAVRTALVRLEQEGLVTRERHRGAKVRLVTEGEAIEILEARAALESLAVRSAARAATPEDIAKLRAVLEEMQGVLAQGNLLGLSELNARLHRCLLESSGHKTALQLIDMLNSQMIRFQFPAILAPGRPEQSLAEDTAIVDAVEAHDEDAAEQAVQTHLANVADALRSQAGTPGDAIPA